MSLSGPQHSTALSDAVLALSGFAIVGKSLCAGNITAAAGFLMMTVAASLGVFRFLQSSPGVKLVDWHQYMSWSTQVLGLPLISAAYLQKNHCNIAAFLVIFGVSVMLLREGHVVPDKFCSVAAEVLGGAATVSIFVQSATLLNSFGVIGPMLIAVAGLAVKTEGKLWGWQRVDIFHYMLAVANFALMKGLDMVNSLQPL